MFWWIHAPIIDCLIISLHVRFDQQTVFLFQKAGQLVELVLPIMLRRDTTLTTADA